MVILLENFKENGSEKHLLMTKDTYAKIMKKWLKLEFMVAMNLHTFPFKDTSLDSVAPNPLDMLPR